MIGRRAILGTLLVLMAVVLSAADRTSEDKDKLQGDWQITEMNIGGNAVEADKLPKATLQVKGDLWLKPLDDTRRVQYHFAIKANQKPKLLDIVSAGNATWPAIYRLKNDVLTVCEPLQSRRQCRRQAGPPH